MDKEKRVLISVSDRTGLLEFAKELVKLNFIIIASGGTASYLQNARIPVHRVSELTKSPEILGGRVKTLHPAIFGGILSRNTESDLNDLLKNSYELIDMVVCNLYPFSSIVKKSEATLSEAIENIDIGGVTLLRAAAKNHDRTIIVCDVNDYDKVVEELNRPTNNREISLDTRRTLALKAFTQTAQYDALISDYFRKQFKSDKYQIDLKYGINPHQKPAQIFNILGKLPLNVLNGSPSYINLCDGLNAWQLVKEVNGVLNLPAAASFKHVSPAGAAVYSEMHDKEFHLKFDTNVELTPLSVAYIKARNADPMSSFGDFIALSDTCDVATARIISREIRKAKDEIGFLAVAELKDTFRRYSLFLPRAGNMGVSLLKEMDDLLGLFKGTLKR